jgi:hypothetical protein
MADDNKGSYCPIFKANMPLIFTMMTNKQPLDKLLAANERRIKNLSLRCVVEDCGLQFSSKKDLNAHKETHKKECTSEDENIDDPDGGTTEADQQEQEQEQATHSLRTTK